MELLDINLPDFTRIQYANLASKNIWEKKIAMARLLYPVLELETVVHDVRPAMINHYISPKDFDYQARQYAKRGLIMVPLQREEASTQFSHSRNPYSGNGNDFFYRTVVTKSIEVAEQFIDAHNSDNHVEIGRLLGFPKECGEFFTDAWSKGYIDPIWQQAENTIAPGVLKNRRDFNDPHGNIEKKLIRLRANDENYKISSVFRYIGVRILSHFPKSFDDAASIEIANKWIQLARDINAVGLEETLDIMRLPFEWDCSKGIAVINTPVLKIVTNSVPCYPNHIIQQESNFYPEEAPNGIQFPWTMKIGC